MAASINDKIIQAQNGGAPQPTTVSSARSISGTSLSCVALTNWPTGTAVHLITYKKKTDGTMDRSTLCLWKGIVSGTTIGTLTLKGGTDAGNSVGDFVEAAPTSAQWQDLYDGLTQEHKVDGKHGDITADSLTINSGGTISLPNGVDKLIIGYQTDNSNTIASNTTTGLKVQAGWSQVVGDNVNSYINDTVTFPTAFTTLLGVSVSILPVKPGGTASSITGFTSDYTTVPASIAVKTPISNSSFSVVLMRTSGIFSSTTYYGYSWFAWGIL